MKALIMSFFLSLVILLAGSENADAQGKGSHYGNKNEKKYQKHSGENKHNAVRPRVVRPAPVPKAVVAVPIPAPVAVPAPSPR